MNHFYLFYFFILVSICLFDVSGNPSLSVRTSPIFPGEDSFLYIYIQSVQDGGKKSIISDERRCGLLVQKEREKEGAAGEDDDYDNKVLPSIFRGRPGPNLISHSSNSPILHLYPHLTAFPSVQAPFNPSFIIRGWLLLLLLLLPVFVSCRYNNILLALP